MAKIQLKHADRYVAPSGKLFLKDRVELVSEADAALLLQDTTVRNGLKLRVFRLLPDAVPTTAETEAAEALARAKAGLSKKDEEDLAQDLVIEDGTGPDLVSTVTTTPASDLDDEDLGVTTLGEAGTTSTEQ
jgi:hypothetical protein